jgi:hypothetical protein
MPIWRNTTGDFLWGTAGNWLIDGTGSGVPTTASDAVFDNLSPACTVNITGAVCRNLNFNSGTGYANTITMTNNITVGSNLSASPNHSVTLSPSLSFAVAGTGTLITRSNGTTTLTGNGKTWPNAFNINTTVVAVNSIISLTDNWTNRGNVVIGPGSGLTLTGAFNFTCLANLNVNVGIVFGSALNSTAALSTIILAGNSTYAALAANIGVNLTINAPGNTVTLADGASYGGAGTQATSAFTYVAGTVVCTGTFHLCFNQSGSGYIVNVNGNPSTSATTTNTTGVNFNNLSLRTAALNGPANCTFTSPICVVNDFSILPSTGTKPFVALTGNTIYANKNFTNNGIVLSGSTTTIQLQGTGVWTENLTLSQGITGFGVGCPVVINTAGTITLGSFVGIRTEGSLTLTAGSFITTGYGLRVMGATLTGLGSGGAVIDSMYHSTAGTYSQPASLITINDSAPLRIGYLTFDGFTTNRTHRYGGTAGWTCDSLYYQQTAGAAGCDIGLVAEPTVVYTVKSSLILRAWNISISASLLVKNSGTASRVIFTLEQGASQDVFYMGATNIDSDAGQTIWSRKGTLTNTLNWSLWTYPKTRFSTFTN